MKILHISDIHMNSDKEESDDTILIADKIANALQECQNNGMNLWPEIVIVTGDFTATAAETEFEQAKQQLKAFYENGQYEIDNMLIVPGNHDYLWEENGKEVKKEERYIPYRNFRNNCEREKICESTVIDNQTLKEGLDKYLIPHIYKEEKDFAVLIIGMNSVILESKERSGQGYFSLKQHKECGKLIQYYKKKSKKKLNILVAFHHHILPVASVERETKDNPEKFSLTIDARRTLDFCVKNGVQMAVHGHQHQPSIVSWKNEVLDSGHQLYVVSSGSMAEKRELLGDSSRNNFMIYDMDKDGTKAYLFETSMHDWDSMTLTGTYFLEFKDWYKEVKCNVMENAFAPMELEEIEFIEKADTSNLYYLFLNVMDCSDASCEIEEYINRYNGGKKKIIICGIHHLYGRYDILLKYRSDETSEQFQNKLVEHLKQKKCMENTRTPYFMNVMYESCGLNKKCHMEILKNPSAYLNSTWNMATLTIFTERKLEPTVFFEELNREIVLFNKENNTKLDDIIRNYSIGQDRVIIFELFISCYQFPMLTRFTNLVENIIKKYGVDKSTHIIYYFDERHV